MRIAGELSWKQRGLAHPVTREAHTLTYHTVTLVGGRVYVHGGFETENAPFHYYTIVSERWTKVPGVRYRFGHTSLLVDDKIYMIGGGRNASFRVPIEAFDLLTHSVDVVEAECQATQHSAAYVPSRRQIFIVGRMPGHKGTKMLCFDVRSKKLVKLTTKGKKPPMRRFVSKLLESKEKVLLLSGEDQLTHLHVLEFIHGHIATWSDMQLSRAVPPNNKVALQVVDGLIFCFGGQNGWHADTNVLFLMDTETANVVRVGPISVSSHAVKRSGNWPNPNSGMAAVAWQGDILMFGGSHDAKLMQLEFKRQENISEVDLKN